MKITKYQHACLIIEDGNQKIVIDPGVWSKIPHIDSVEAVIITHVHPDHLDVSKINSLLVNNPELTIVGTDEVLAELKNIDVKTRLVNQGDKVVLGNFNIEIFGHDHAVIYETVPCQNFGILINDNFYYPGDSFSLPGKAVEVLAVPASAPWMKADEAMNFIKNISAKKVFPSHNALLSKEGEAVTYRWLSMAAQASDSEWVVLEPGDNI